MCINVECFVFAWIYVAAEWMLIEKLKMSLFIWILDFDWLIYLLLQIHYYDKIYLYQFGVWKWVRTKILPEDSPMSRQKFTVNTMSNCYIRGQSETYKNKRPLSQILQLNRWVVDPRYLRWHHRRDLFVSSANWEFDLLHTDLLFWRGKQNCIAIKCVIVEPN